MSEKNNGGPAFPLSHSHVDLENSNWKHANGATLRDYFAAKAMHALIVDAADEACSASDDETVRQERNEFAYDVATDAYRYADAMLRARDA